MKNRNIPRLAIAALALAVSGAASAQFSIVSDPVHTAVSTANGVTALANAATNTITTGATLAGVIHQKEIENAIRNLEFASDDHFGVVELHQTSVENHQSVVENNWTENNYYDYSVQLPPEGVTPIPFSTPSAGIETHQSQFKAMDDYAAGDRMAVATNQRNATAAVLDTNAAQLSFMKKQSDEIAGTIERLQELGNGMMDEKVLKSRNGQLQYANLIGLENTAQLVRLRETMLVSENANNARAQLQADMQSRQFANGERISESAELSGATTSW